MARIAFRKIQTHGEAQKNLSDLDLPPPFLNLMPTVHACVRARTYTHPMCSPLESPRTYNPLPVGCSLCWDRPFSYSSKGKHAFSISLSFASSKKSSLTAPPPVWFRYSSMGLLCLLLTLLMAISLPYLQSRCLFPWSFLDNKNYIFIHLTFPGT